MKNIWNEGLRSAGSRWLRFALSYNVAQNFDISELVGDLTEEHRDAVIACADEGLPLIENAKVFASLPAGIAGKDRNAADRNKGSALPRCFQAERLVKK